MILEGYNDRGYWCPKAVQKAVTQKMIFKPKALKKAEAFGHPCTPLCYVAIA